jgi:ATP-dependent helicase/nuclease subunit A
MPEFPVDQAARDAALDIARSVIVQAPAGSGKTDLLTRRFLKLLAVVDEPEDILAITFTRAATAEMRARILLDLEAAAALRLPSAPDQLPRIALAREALAQSARRGWDILNHPERLAIDTIDSLSLRIAHDRPLLARLGGRLQPTEEATPLYALAARRTLDRLGGADAELDAALAHVLDLRDNRLAACEELLAKMLATRDQWQHALPLSHSMTEEDWDLLRVNLQAPFHRAVHRTLAEAYRLLSDQPAIAHQILDLANYAGLQGNANVAILAGVHTLSAAMPLDHWKSLCDFLTREGEWRKTVDIRHSFRSDTPEQKQRRRSMIALLKWLQHKPDLLAALCAIRDLPSSAYSEAQWLTLRHILTVLRHAMAELRVVFAEQNAVDFTELSLAAIDVLQQVPDRAIARHLLVDEFQDTSRRQHDLLTHIVRAWDPGSDAEEHRTVFLVGDPMQSVYMFRQAEVELFTHVWNHGLGPDDARIPCGQLKLSVNFRSHAGVTEPLNEFFEAICTQEPPPGSAPGEFAPATAHAVAPEFDGSYVQVHPLFIDSADPRPEHEKSAGARRQEAQEIAAILQRTRAEHPEYRVAVLVRARRHLAELVPLLRDRAIPFRAVEIDTLADRQELLDLCSLTRALLHPMDRIAWLAVLRAPWCGLTLADLHCLTGSDDPTCKTLSVVELIDRHQHLLSPDGRERLARTAQILRRALDLRWRLSESPSFASWIERTWRTLGGPAALSATALENCEVFFTLLDAVAPDGLAPLTPDFDAQLDRLFAQPEPSGGIELMTIHKAKGLGFDVVIVPGLERQPARDDLPLLASLERRDPWDTSADEFLVAPIGPQGIDADPILKWVVAQRKLRIDEERKRLFYVACTRARTGLHLFGTATISSSGLQPGDKSSLLAAAWPALEPEFVAQLQKPQPAVATRPNVIAFPAPGQVAALAAVAEPVTPRCPSRLPLDSLPAPAANVAVPEAALVGRPLDRPAAPEFSRPEGSRLARVIGAAVHALLERLGPSLAALPTEQLRGRAASMLRASALTGDALENATATVTNLLCACAADPVCRWILAPHPEAQSEASWSGFADSRLRTLRADRVFRAGSAPLAEGSDCLWAEGSDCLWIVDYKTGAAPAGDPAAFIAAGRQTYAPQLLAYGRALRAIHGPETQLRLGLYYPAIAFFDWWDPSRS